MKKHYLVFKKDDEKTFVGFTSIDPTLTSGIVYSYEEVDEEVYKEKKREFERNLTL